MKTRYMQNAVARQSTATTLDQFYDDGDQRYSRRVVVYHGPTDREQFAAEDAAGRNEFGPTDTEEPWGLVNHAI
jgi:hypothetical protein